MAGSCNELDLFVSVAKKLDKDDIRPYIRKELAEASAQLNGAIQRNFKYRLIMENVETFLENKMITDYEKRKSDKVKVFSPSLFLNLSKKYIPCEAKSGIELFGIKKDFVDRILKDKQTSLLETEELNKAVEKKIDDFCVKLTEYSGYALNYRYNWRKSFKDAMDYLILECERLNQAEFDATNHETAISDMLTVYYKELEQGISMLKQLIPLHEKKLNFEFLLEKMLTDKFDALSSKIKRFDSEVMKSTYTSKSIEALKIISKELEKKRRKLEESLNTATLDVQAYHLLGEEYDALVKEYTDLCTHIHDQQWALDSLKRRQSSGTAGNTTISENNASKYTIDTSCIDTSHIDTSNIDSSSMEASINDSLKDISVNKSEVSINNTCKDLSVNDTSVSSTSIKDASVNEKNTSVNYNCKNDLKKNAFNEKDDVLEDDVFIEVASKDDSKLLLV